jgi:hypothetical protein
MKRERRRTSHAGDIQLSPGGTAAVDVRQALLHLRQYLIHTRDVPNGKDFLFSGPSGEIHAALTRLVALEHMHSGGLQYNYTQIDEFFLLRVLGSPDRQREITSLFEDSGT